MSCYQIIINPRDRLFFGDAKPISGADIGFGARWPLPTSIHSALMTAMYEKWPTLQVWEQEHKNKNNKDINWDNSQMRFGGLKTWGIFPIKKGKDESGNFIDEIFVPTPADVQPDGNLMKLIKIKAESDGTANQSKVSSNLPSPLKYAVCADEATKEEIKPWISIVEFEKYLKGEKIGKTVSNSELFDSETTPGIGIDSATGTTVEGKFYQAIYIRLKPDVSMLAFAECYSKKDGKSVDVLDMLFPKDRALPIVFGGQRCLAYVDAKREQTQLCKLTDDFHKRSGTIVKWTLLSPSIFNKGWLPDWVDENGKVKLKDRKERNGLPYKDWVKLKENFPEIDAHLIAARVPKPLVISGWKLDKNADCAGGVPKATRLAVPAGAVYYFECKDEAETAKLAKELHGNVRSSHLGEQGFGLGVCSILKKEELIS